MARDNPFLLLCLLCKNFGWNCIILTIMSLMEFSLGHLEPWLWLVIVPRCFSHFLLSVVIGFSEDEHNLVNALYYVPKFLFVANFIHLCGLYWHLGIAFAFYIFPISFVNFMAYHVVYSEFLWPKVTFWAQILIISSFIGCTFMKKLVYFYCFVKRLSSLKV